MDLDEPLTAASLGSFVADSRNIYLLAQVDGHNAGTLHAIHYEHPGGRTHVYIDELDTDRAWRRLGVASRLMAEVLSIAREMGASEAWLGADEANHAAHALYLKLRPSEVDPGVIYSYKV